jgi:hypothetical protein
MEKGLTVRDVIERLSKCDQGASVMLDDNGIGLEIVDVADAGFKSYTYDGQMVDAVYVIYRGQMEAAERLREAINSTLESRNDDKKDATDPGC